MNSDRVEEHIEKAAQILDEAFVTIDHALNELCKAHADSFVDNPIMLPTLYVSAMCRYISLYLMSFPEDIRPGLIALISKNLGLNLSAEKQFDLLSATTVGNA